MRKLTLEGAELGAGIVFMRLTLMIFVANGLYAASVGIPSYRA